MSKAAASSSMEVDDTKPSGTVLQRLMITKLVLENFKSYGGRKEIGTFHKVPAFAFWGLGVIPHVSRLFTHNISFYNSDFRLSSAPMVRANPM